MNTLEGSSMWLREHQKLVCCLQTLTTENENWPFCEDDRAPSLRPQQGVKDPTSTGEFEKNKGALTCGACTRTHAFLQIWRKQSACPALVPSFCLAVRPHSPRSRSSATLHWCFSVWRFNKVRLCLLHGLRFASQHTFKV